jgi:hypothetical protein
MATGDTQNYSYGKNFRRIEIDENFNLSYTPATSAGSYDVLTRNSTTGDIEVVSSSSLSPAIPLNQVAYGTGTSITSSANLTFNGSTLVITGGLTVSSLTSGRVPRATTAGSLIDGTIRDDGTNVGIGVAPNSSYKVYIDGSQNSAFRLRIRNSLAGTSSKASLDLISDTASGLLFVNSSLDTSYGGANSMNLYQFGQHPIAFLVNDTVNTKIFGATGNWVVGSSSPTDAGYKFDVAGTGRFQNRLTVKESVSGWVLGQYAANTSFSALYVSQVTESSTNYTMLSNGVVTRINGTSAGSGYASMDIDGTVKLATLNNGNVVINNGVTDAGFKLYVNGTFSASGAATFAAISATSLTATGLTAGRIPYVGTGGLLQDSANLTYSATFFAASVTNGHFFQISGNNRLSVGNTSVAVETCYLALAAGTTTYPSFNIPAGVAPTTPTNGDIWQDGTNVYIRIAGVTKTFTIA